MPSSRRWSQLSKICCGCWTIPTEALRQCLQMQHKYQRERIYMYLCVDEEEDENPGNRDSEEVDLHVERGVPVQEVKELLLTGTFQSNNMAAAYLALEVLTKMGYSLD
uniref:Uncharacterized protein n=1 Tax=Rhodosorus marinus TaxID=101924 RepID=A0A7S0BEA1_9RHOD|mmetsp:Transcript_12254/g.17791  ORF Transcript_12254/g.17791 Transcript_12254/m.17791 type:complete len:108 (+) Transcript_12254:863-1186(+)